MREDERSALNGSGDQSLRGHAGARAQRHSNAQARREAVNRTGLLRRRLFVSASSELELNSAGLSACVSE